MLPDGSLPIMKNNVVVHHTMFGMNIYQKIYKSLCPFIFNWNLISPSRKIRTENIFSH